MNGGFFLPNIRKGKYVKFIKATTLVEIVAIYLLFFWILSMLGLNLFSSPKFFLYPTLIAILYIIPFKGQRLLPLLINILIDPLVKHLDFPIEGEVKYAKVIRLPKLQIGISQPEFYIQDKQVFLEKPVTADVYDTEGYLIESIPVDVYTADFNYKKKKATFYIEQVSNIVIQQQIEGKLVYHKKPKEPKDAQEQK